ncbi:MAG: hypothetical protein ABIQ11_12430, partial [Saprospiraceae bacterium]
LVKSLLLHYSSREVNKDKYEKYISIQDKYLYTQEWEIKSFRWLSQLQLYQMQYTSSPDEPLIEIARNYTILLNSIHDIKTHQFLLNRHKINILYHEFIHDFASILILSDEFINRIKPAFRSSSMVLSINIRKLFAMIQLGRNDAAIECGQTILKISSIESFGWFLGGYYTLKAYLYNKNYRESAFLISKIYENPKFKRLSSTLNEAFNATLGCIHLLKSVYHPADTQFKTSLPEFKLYKFLNTIPTFSKDKRGLNVTILLMHIGFLLLRKDYNGIIDRVDSLKHYAYRHLRRDDTFRSNCMIKMVIQMTKADFHPIRTARYTEDLLAKLKEVNLAGSGKNIETEIIPYEVLWDIMMKTCETNFYSKRTKGIA